MITSFVRDGQSYLKCAECNAEHIILCYEVVNGRNWASINMEKTLEKIDAFKTKHALCKGPAKQLRIIDGELDI